MNTTVSANGVFEFNQVQVFNKSHAVPNIPCIYVFEVEKGVVKCGCSKKAENCRDQLYDIQRHRGVEVGGRFAILPINRECIIRSERLFFSKLKSRLPGTEIFNITFEYALRKLREINIPENYNIFYLSSEEKKQLEQNEKHSNESSIDLTPIMDNILNGQQIMDNILNGRNELERLGTMELEYMKAAEWFRNDFLSIAERSSNQIITRLWSEYRYILRITKEIISPYLWDMTLMKTNLKDEDGQLLNIIPDWIDESNALVVSSLKTQLDIVLDFLEVNINDIYKGNFEVTRILFRSETAFIGLLVKIIIFYSGFKENCSKTLLKAKDRLHKSAKLLITYLFERSLITFFSVYENKNEKIEQHIKKAKLRLHDIGQALNYLLKREREDNKLIINMHNIDLNIDYNFGLLSV